MYRKYTGSLEYEKGIAYFIFESDLKDEFEKVIVQVKVPRGDDENIMVGLVEILLQKRLYCLGNISTIQRD